MPVVKKIPKTEVWELRDHRDNTADLYIKGYTLAQLSVMNGQDTRTIKASGKYLPIRVDDSHNLYRYKNGIVRTPYRVLRIRLDEVKHIFNKKTGKKLTVEYN